MWQWFPPLLTRLRCLSNAMTSLPFIHPTTGFSNCYDKRPKVMHLKYGTMTAIACLRHALERQDLSCTYLAHHELQSVLIIITIIRHKQGVQTFSCH